MTEKGQDAPALEGSEKAIPAVIRPSEAKVQRITPEARLEPYAFRPLVFGEEAEEFLRGKIGKAGEQQRVGVSTKTA